MTMNSPESLTVLFNLATASKDKKEAVQVAELMREIGLKCIGFNGVCWYHRRENAERVYDADLLWQVPRTINCLGAFRNSLPSDVVSALSTKPTR